MSLFRTLLFSAALMGLSTHTIANAANSHHSPQAPQEKVVVKKDKEKSADLEKVNINTSDAEQIQKIKGLGPKKALAIVEYRKANGNFKSLEDLAKVHGISEKLAQRIGEHITF
ncbi:MAG: helix-hairpin-helix domain-containing protein [Legionellales bacterium]|nr:helix-hairpin-helix domain-containing protein [Legionellales bacterium]